MKYPLIIYTGGTIGMRPTAAGFVPDDTLPETLRRHDDFCDQAFDLISLPTLIDSAAINIAHWQLIINTIHQHSSHDRHTGVIILHGTDTLAHTAAMLSFFLAQFTLPIVLTGAMRPIHTRRDDLPSDGWQNLRSAFDALQNYDRGIYVAFGGQLMHGARVTKFDGSSDEAFTTPNGDRPYHITPSYRPLSKRPLQPIRLAQYHCSPYSTAADFAGIKAAQPEALLISVYGSGTVPDMPSFFHELRLAIDEGLLAVAISQCAIGRIDFSAYAASQRLEEAGCLSAGDMTREACLAKLFYIQQLSMNQAEKRRLFTDNLIGERI